MYNASSHTHLCFTAMTDDYSIYDNNIATSCKGSVCGACLPKHMREIQVYSMG